MSRREQLEVIADHAQRLMEDKYLNRILDGMEAEIVHAITEENMNDYANANERRDRLIVSLQQVKKIRRWLLNCIQHGNFEAMQRELSEQQTIN